MPEPRRIDMHVHMVGNGVAGSGGWLRLSGWHRWLAVLMNCLTNCQKIGCSDSRYGPFWRRMAESGLPLLANTGGENTVPVVNARLADPKLLRLPLECGVIVIAAHCATKSGLGDPDY